MTKLEEEIKKYYKELYNVFDNSQLTDWFKDKEKSCHFTGMQGKNYKTQVKKLLIIGKSTNGWGQLNTKDAETFSQDALEKMKNEYIDDNMKERMSDAFWFTSYLVWHKLTGKEIDTRTDMFANYIAWTNLYKIVPQKENSSKMPNPNENQRLIQLEIVKKILKAEFAFFNPTHILFITEQHTKNEEHKTWWNGEGIEPFIKDYNDIQKMNGFLNIKNIPGDYVRGKSLYSDENVKNVKIVIATRPDYWGCTNQERDFMADKICSAFNNI